MLPVWVCCSPLLRRDKPPADHWPLPNYRVIKVLMNFWDVRADGGATAVVPGSVSLTLPLCLLQRRARV